MRTLDPTIPLHTLLWNQISGCLQASSTYALLCQREGDEVDVTMRSVMEGNSLKVDDQLLGDFYALCMEVKERLQFKEDIDFYITGNSEVNAMSFASTDSNRPHIIEINSGLFNLMNREELKFVIGHEIGHLINQDTVILRLFQFVYPDDDSCPAFLSKRVALFRQIAELGADRYGYMACENLDACITSIFKIASGLFLDKMNVSIETLIKENSQRLEYFLKDKGKSEGSHPVNPIRIQAMSLFAKAKTQKALNEGMDELVSIMQTFIYEPIDQHLSAFVASAGLLMAGIDGKRNKNEDDAIISQLGSFCLLPIHELKRIEKGDVSKIFNDSVQAILDLDSSMRMPLVGYVIDVAFADGKLEEGEIEFVYKFANSLGIPVEETSKAMHIAIIQKFRPDIKGLK